MRTSGFTLIELLIVVAIIAILAAIAVPNFLEAQTRAKVSRTQADMRTLATALELYTVDHNRTMTSLTGFLGAPSPSVGPSLISSSLLGSRWVSYRLRRLTTPIAYINQVIPDVFVKDGRAKPLPNKNAFYDTFDYADWYYGKEVLKGVASGGRTSGGAWRLSSAGPDMVQAYGGAMVGSAYNYLGVDYDATNGTISTGDIVRVGGVARTPPGQVPAINRVSFKYNDPAL